MCWREVTSELGGGEFIGAQNSDFDSQQCAAAAVASFPRSTQTPARTRSWNSLWKASILRIWPRVAWSHCATPLCPNFTMVLLAYHRRKALRPFAVAASSVDGFLTISHLAIEQRLLMPVILVRALAPILGIGWRHAQSGYRNSV